MAKYKGQLERLARRLDELAPALPIMMLTYGIPEDGLYHTNGRTYTREEVDELEKFHRLIILTYGDCPHGDGEQIQMTWGDE